MDWTPKGPGPKLLRISEVCPDTVRLYFFPRTLFCISSPGARQLALAWCPGTMAAPRPGLAWCPDTIGLTHPALAERPHISGTSGNPARNADDQLSTNHDLEHDA